MSEHDKINLIRLRKALYQAIMNHPEAKRVGAEALARCRPLPPKNSEHYKDAQNMRVMAFINAGKIPLLEAVQQDENAVRVAARALKECKETGVSVAETTDRMLVAGATFLEANANIQPPHVPTHDRETHERFRQVVNDDRAAKQAPDISNEIDGNKPN